MSNTGRVKVFGAPGTLDVQLSTAVFTFQWELFRSGGLLKCTHQVNQIFDGCFIRTTNCLLNSFQIPLQTDSLQRCHSKEYFSYASPITVRCARAGKLIASRGIILNEFGNRTLLTRRTRGVVFVNSPYDVFAQTWNAHYAEDWYREMQQRWIGIQHKATFDKWFSKFNSFQSQSNCLFAEDIKGLWNKSKNWMSLHLLAPRNQTERHLWIIKRWKSTFALELTYKS